MIGTVRDREVSASLEVADSRIFSPDISPLLPQASSVYPMLPSAHRLGLESPPGGEAGWGDRLVQVRSMGSPQAALLEMLENRTSPTAP